MPRYSPMSPHSRRWSVGNSPRSSSVVPGPRRRWPRSMRPVALVWPPVGTPRVVGGYRRLAAGSARGAWAIATTRTVLSAARGRPRPDRRRETLPVLWPAVSLQRRPVDREMRSGSGKVLLLHVQEAIRRSARRPGRRAGRPATAGERPEQVVPIHGAVRPRAVGSRHDRHVRRPRPSTPAEHGRGVRRAARTGQSPMRCVCPRSTTTSVLDSDWAGRSYTPATGSSLSRSHGEQPDPLRQRCTKTRPCSAGFVLAVYEGKTEEAMDRSKTAITSGERFG